MNAGLFGIEGTGFGCAMKVMLGSLKKVCQPKDNVALPFEIRQLAKGQKPLCRHECLFLVAIWRTIACVRAYDLREL